MAKKLDAREQRLTDYASAFRSLSGERVLQYLTESLDVPSYTEGADALRMAYREGRRSVLRDILAAVKAGELLVENLGADDPDQQVHAEGAEAAWQMESHLE